MKQLSAHAFPFSLHTEEQWVLGATQEGDSNDSVNDSPPGRTGDWGPVLSTRKISALKETEWHLLQDFNPNLKSGSTDFSHSAHVHFLRPPPHVNMQKHGWHSVPTPCLARRETKEHQKLDDSRDSFSRYKEQTSLRAEFSEHRQRERNPTGIMQMSHKGGEEGRQERGRNKKDREEIGRKRKTNNPIHNN